MGDGTVLPEIADEFQNVAREREFWSADLMEELASGATIQGRPDIPEEVQRHVFDPFFTTNRAQGNTGLGLYIVHNLVTQQLGGTIALVSALGKGTTISMTLPLRAPGQVKPAAPAGHFGASSMAQP